MGPKTCLFALCALLISVEGKLASSSGGENALKPGGGGSKEVVPMVAFLCGKPSMHLTPSGWVSDARTDCIKDPVKILDYCKKMYPSKAKQITNVVELSHKVQIDNWCRFGHNHCSHHGRHEVRPFKCLVGAFQSEALLVPNHCVFDHIHKTKECKSLKAWNTTAEDSCHRRGMSQQSCAILLPCGVNVFGGVEFVCCPPENKDSKESVDVDESSQLQDEDSNESSESTETSTETDSEEFDDYWDISEDEDEYYSEEDEDDTISTEDKTASEETEESVESEDRTEEKSTESEDQPAQPLVSDAYTEYLHKPNKDLNEHDYFFRAKAELQKHHHERVTKMMKDWAAARQRVQDMKNTDSKAADKLNKEITIRFQKTYQALEQEGQAEKKQLVALHQQRVQADLNERKRHAMEHYMSSLQKKDTDTAQILKSLQHYIKTEQKDRMHTINHYKHLKDTDPAEAESVHQQTRDHLAIIDQRIQQAIEMLDRVPAYAKKIKQQVENFMTSFREIDMSIHNLLEKPIKKLKTTAEDILQKYKSEAKAAVPPKPKKTVNPTPKVERKPSGTQKPELHKVVLSKVQPENPKINDEDMEDEHAYIRVNEPHVAAIAANELHMDQSNSVKAQMLTKNSVAMGSSMAIAIGCIAVFVVIVIGIIILRKRALRVPISHGFVDGEHMASPEERHVSNMQINGYENPTYKYFEMNGNGSA